MDSKLNKGWCIKIYLFYDALLEQIKYTLVNVKNTPKNMAPLLIIKVFDIHNQTMRIRDCQKSITNITWNYRGIFYFFLYNNLILQRFKKALIKFSR